MKKNKTHVKLLVLLLLTALLGCALGTGLAASTGTLTVQIKESPTPARPGLDGFTIGIYKIGRTDTEKVWALDSAYAGTGVLEATTSEEMDAASRKVDAIITAAGTKPVKELTTGADGKVVFSDLEVGVYMGKMTAGPGGFSMTPFVVTVPWNNGKSVSYEMTVEPKIAYQAEGSYAPQVRKEMAGRDLRENEFFFTLRDAEGRTIETVSNKADGSVDFSELSYTLADVANSPFRYTIQEVIPAEADREANVTYDDTVKNLQVELADNGDGTLAVTETLNQTMPVFRNAYETPVYTLTIYYIYANGQPTPIPTVVEIHYEGDEYNVPSPVLAGYTRTPVLVSGIMPGNNLEYTVIYTPTGIPTVPIDDDLTPLGLGNVQIHVGVCYE